MLKFLYTSDYDIETEDFHGTPLSLHAQMYSLADRYCIDSLLALAADKYEDSLQKNLMVGDYLSSISEVYTPLLTNRALRYVAVAFGRKVLRKAITQDKLGTQLRLVICDVPEFGYDIAEAFITAPILGSCENCGPNSFGGDKGTP